MFSVDEESAVRLVLLSDILIAAIEFLENYLLSLPYMIAPRTSSSFLRKFLPA